jgi:membrane-bound acyltransferase YfiQ involved in biofilm formation
MSHFLQQMKCLFTASFIFTRLFVYFIKPTSHACHKWSIIHEEEPTYEQMKHMGILWIWKLAAYCPFCGASPHQAVRQEPR